MTGYGMHNGDGKGFSLVELLAVLAIVSLLLSLALPAYRGQVLRAKRVQGQAALLKTMQQQERYYSQHNRYLAFSAGAGGADGTGGGAQAAQFAWWSGEGGEEGAARSAYELDAAACPGSTIAQCVLLRARPGTERVDRQFRDTECGTLTLSSTGERGSAGPEALCWP